MFFSKITTDTVTGPGLSDVSSKCIFSVLSVSAQLSSFDAVKTKGAAIIDERRFSKAVIERGRT